MRYDPAYRKQNEKYVEENLEFSPGYDTINPKTGRVHPMRYLTASDAIRAMNVKFWDTVDWKGTLIGVVVLALIGQAIWSMIT